MILGRVPAQLKHWLRNIVQHIDRSCSIYTTRLESYQKSSDVQERKQEPLNAKEKKNHKRGIPYDQDSDLLSKVITEENSSPATELASVKSSIDYNEDSLSSSASIFEQQDWEDELSSEK